MKVQISKSGTKATKASRLCKIFSNYTSEVTNLKGCQIRKGEERRPQSLKTGKKVPTNYQNIVSKRKLEEFDQEKEKNQNCPQRIQEKEATYSGIDQQILEHSSLKITQEKEKTVDMGTILEPKDVVVDLIKNFQDEILAILNNWIMELNNKEK
ncbi:29485_t:CDS:2 [Gigaspora margarita]|uniref:29485_t:CDS:1 n=1 Tax=Gigaspora margarita TaxID=4874 RepID=A0ABN7VHX5_GIGMA|nr:29485_t:CDS:2 [Gigaspora margarita]